jgi:hypothetical protein
MADLCAELRAKCTDDLHRKFHTFALASGKEGAEVLRGLVSEWVAREEHAHTMRCRLLRSEVLGGDGSGSASA